jgi:hydroxymethylbilane synthase
VQDALLNGDADIAVHSAKDLPSSTSVEGLELVGMLERGDPRDALVGVSLDSLPEGALVATGSVRRQVQLQAMRPDIRFTSLRGNIGTRLQKLDDFDEIAAIVMAGVALERLGWADRIAHIFEPHEMVPQVGQGALAVECRADDHHTIAALKAVCHAETTTCVMAERAFLAQLGGACDLPVGAYAVIKQSEISLSALVAGTDGTIHRQSAVGSIANKIGVEVAEYLLHQVGGRDAIAQSHTQIT